MGLELFGFWHERADRIPPHISSAGEIASLAALQRRSYRAKCVRKRDRSPSTSAALSLPRYVCSLRAGWPVKALILLAGMLERASGIEPLTSSLGTNPSREIAGTTETNRAELLDFFDPHQPCCDRHFRDFPAE
jgi:hypothetical protein